MSGYDYYREYGVNVKVYSMPYVKGQEILSEEVLGDIYEYIVTVFWDTLTDRTKEEYDLPVYSEGRMGGWAVLGTGTFEPPKKWIDMVNDLKTFMSQTYYKQVVEDEIEDVLGENPKLAKKSE
jgi:hypothetical protein